jgi:hypothetical protein
LDLSIDQVVGLSIHETGGEEVLLSLDEEGNWQMVEPHHAGAGELDILLIEQILAQFLEWRELTAMEPISELEAVGLAYPAYRIKLVLSNGETEQVDIGDQTVTGTGYYVRVRGRLPQVVGAASVDGVVALVQAPPVLPTPTPTFDSAAEPIVEPESTESP